MLNVTEKEIEIAEKSERRIVLRSHNFCPMLEAYKKLKLDTKIICKKLFFNLILNLFLSNNPIPYLFRI